eukprot:Gb_03419 [translate_table: standard]
MGSSVWMLLLWVIIVMLPAIPKIVITTNFLFDHRWDLPEDKADIREMMSVYCVMTTSLVMLDECQMEKEEARMEDVRSLMLFRKAISTDPNALLFAWTTTNSENVCSWRGIRCRKGSRRVVALVLLGLGLKGIISPSLGLLSLLRTLNHFIERSHLKVWHPSISTTIGSSVPSHPS